MMCDLDICQSIVFSIVCERVVIMILLYNKRILEHFSILNQTMCICQYTVQPLIYQPHTFNLNCLLDSQLNQDLLKSSNPDKFTFTNEQQVIKYKASVIINYLYTIMGCGNAQQNTNNVELLTSNRYLRLELLGTGSHSRVYRTYDNINKIDYAQKVFEQLPSSISKVNAFPTINDHFNKFLKLKQERLVKYHNIYFKDGEINLIMDLSKQNTLKNYIKAKGKCNEVQGSKIMRQILEGLLQIHNFGFLHNDLKPSNILIFQNQYIKLSDYGIAELFDSRFRQNKQSGLADSGLKWDNIPYMAPQIVKNIGSSPVSDVWSAGCILIELLTGKKAWTTLGSQEQTFKKISSVVVPPLPAGISASCSNFLQNCLAIVPSQRTVVSQLLNHPFIIGKNQPAISNQKRKEANQRKQSIKKQEILDDSQFISSKLQQNKSSPTFDKKATRVATRIIEENRFATVDNTDKIAKIEQKNTQKNKNISKKNISLSEKKQVFPGHVVMLNNKPTILEQKLYRNTNHHHRISTGQTQWTSPSRVKAFTVKEHQQIDQIDKLLMNHSISQAESSLQDIPQFVPNTKSRMRMETEPNYQFQDKQYFKKPLKLLKKKIQERRADQQFQKRLKTEVRKHSAMQQISKLLDQQKQKQRSQTEQLYFEGCKSNRDDLVIDTELARLERDRYNQFQKFMMFKRKEERLRWQNQLKSGQQLLKREAIFKYHMK